MGCHRLTLLGGFALMSEGREIEVPASALRLTSLYALESICEQLLTMGRHAEASAAAMAAVHSEPRRESAHRALIRISLAEGNASEALRQYRSYTTLLRDELNLAPSEQMRTLVRALSAAGHRSHD